MKWTIPGTTLQIDRKEAEHVEDIFQSMFLAGGMVLGQVAQITGLEYYTVQNWVKRGFLSPPKNRRYSLSQLCRIIQINMLRKTLSLETVCRLLEYINGKLDEEKDDLIDDATLFFLFVRLAVQARQLDEPHRWEAEIEDSLKHYQEPVPGARERVEKALQIMLTAWIASQMRQAAETMLQQL